MISYIKGQLEYIGEDFIIVDNNQIGYEIKVPISVISNLPLVGESVKIYTYLYVREDMMKLYGFLSMDHIDVFKKLLSVSGIGPKGALGILSIITPDDLKYAIISSDVDTICKAPGIGKKTAQKLILDLKDKFKLEDYTDTVSREVSNVGDKSLDCKGEAIYALTSLGYSNAEAVKVITYIKDYTTTEDLIKKALKKLAKI
jgi:Holliday junction DNA helicase RuvA